MKIITCARVSSAEQEEGYSLDAQQRAMRERAAQQGWIIVKEFRFSETARKVDERTQFCGMLEWLEKNAKSLDIHGLLFHKLDRACRNMADAFRLKQLEEKYKLLFCENSFGEGPAGVFTFNILASVAQYFSDNLRSEVMKGMAEKAQRGWYPTRAPYGYCNDSTDENCPIKVDADNAKVVKLMFEWYASGQTLDEIWRRLKKEGYGAFTRSNIGNILANRFYIGQLMWHGRILPAKHKAIVSNALFNAVQDRLAANNRRLGRGPGPLELPFGNGFLRSRYDGSAITGERTIKKYKNGRIANYYYYRANRPASGHKIRWAAEKLESAIVAQLSRMQLPDPEVAQWFRNELTAELAHEEQYRADVTTTMRKREGELESRQNRLLDAYVTGAIEKTVFEAKNKELLLELARVRDELATDAQANQDFKALAIAVFDLTQNAVTAWMGASPAIKRNMLASMCSNLELDAANLYLTWRKPFDALVNRPTPENGIPGGIRTSDLSLRRAALYPAELRVRVPAGPYSTSPYLVCNSKSRR